MNSLIRYVPVLIGIFAFALVFQPAQAFPAKDLMEKFSLEERHMYVTALVHMASYHAAIDDDQTRVECIWNWYHKPDHVKAITYIEKAFVRYPDWDGVQVVTLILNQKCGKPSYWPE